MKQAVATRLDIKAEQEQLMDSISQLLKQAKQKGATSAEVDASLDNGFTATVRLGEVETVEHQLDKGVGITVYFGQRKGSTSTSDTRPEALAEALDKACSIAKFAAEDPYAGLADADTMAYDYPDLDLYHPWGLTPDQAIAMATECEALGMAVDKRLNNSEGAAVASQQFLTAYGNSHGFLGSFATTRQTASLVLIAQEGESMQRDYYYTVARDHMDMEPLKVVAEKAAQRTLRRLHGRKIATQKAPVIFTAEMARSLIGQFLAAISGSSLYRKSSFLLDSLGQQIFPEAITISEAPHLKKALGSRPFDTEGARTKARDIIKDGVLQGYILSSYSARKLAMTATGNAGGVRNVTLSTNDLDLTAMQKQMGTGLVVTEMMGSGVNLVTGDYSRGASGYWVENGEFKHPVEEITIAGNLRDMFAKIALVGNDVDIRGNVRTGSILISEMMIAGE